MKLYGDAGCRVDFKEERVWFKPDIVEKQIGMQKDRYKMVRSSLTDPFCKELPEDDIAWPEDFRVDYGFNVVWMYDYPTWRIQNAYSKRSDRYDKTWQCY